MSELIRSELMIFLVMSGCGMSAGLVAEVFKKFIDMKGFRRIGNIITQLVMYAVIGVMISEFFYYCDNGKLTATGMGSFLIGLLLWKKFFCGILTVTEGDNDEDKGRSKRF